MVRKIIASSALALGLQSIVVYANASTSAQPLDQWKTIVSTLGFAVDVPANSSYSFVRSWDQADLGADDANLQPHQFIRLSAKDVEIGHISVWGQIPADDIPSDAVGTKEPQEHFGFEPSKSIAEEYWLQAKGVKGSARVSGDANDTLVVVSFWDRRKNLQIRFSFKEMDPAWHKYSRQHISDALKMKWRVIKSFRWLPEKVRPNRR
jgi:hypothetical protein